jgi:ectoine hydroxylase-related dioxygenase (phytanoyl-CoA dioxygenase family)
VYLEKDPGENSYVALHTDDCSCDETKFVPFHIWIPLVDTHRENGCICVVKGSHLATNTVRGIQIPQHYHRHQQTLLENYLTPLENKAGEALIYHPSLLHYSYPNLSDAMRPAVVAAFIPKDATPIVYYKRNKWLDKSVLEYEMNSAQYCHWNEKEEPKTRSLRKIKMPADNDRSPDFIKTIAHANR